MKYPLMPKATAIWLVENTALTFTQIAEFCGLHELEVQGRSRAEAQGPVDMREVQGPAVSRAVVLQVAKG